MKKIFLLSTCLCFSVMSQLNHAANQSNLQNLDERSTSSEIAAAVPQLTTSLSQTPPNQGMQDLSASLAATEYDSDTEYELHQKVHERFFRRKTLNTVARDRINAFQDDPSSPINLAGISSRTRILLFRELIANEKGSEKNIPFIIHNYKFYIKLSPTPNQPGNGMINRSYNPALASYQLITALNEEDQTQVANHLLEARKNKFSSESNISTDMENQFNKDQLDLLNIILDFEIARRLIGTQDEENKAYPVIKKSKSPLASPINGTKTVYAAKYDRVPIGSAIMGILYLPTLDKENFNYIPLEKFFLADKVFTTGYYERFNFPYGDYMPFAGAADPNHREFATKRILKKLRARIPKLNTAENIHCAYLDCFGGASESEGDSDYSTFDKELKEAQVKSKQQMLTLRPKSIYSEEIIKEIATQASSNTKEIDLQEKTLIFVSEEEQFDTGVAQQVVNVILETCPELEVLNLSLIKLPPTSLTYFCQLLTKNSFHYLDITADESTDSISDGRLKLKCLEEYLKGLRVKDSDILKIFKKVIWITPKKLEQLDSQKQEAVPRSGIPDVYKELHREYYKRRKTTEETEKSSLDQWELPF